MLNFNFQNTTKILFGKGQIPEIANEIPASARILITCGGGSAEKNGTLAKVRDALSGRMIVEFGGIEANPTYETLMKGVEIARREKIDYLLAVGGGSVIDGTKFMAAAISFDGEPWDILVKQAAVATAVPFGVVLTLPATGSEMNEGAVISRTETKDKLVFFTPLVAPQFSVLDPEVTFSLPPRQIANGVCDAFVHVVEQYLTYPVNAPLQDRMAEGILLTLIEEGPKTLANSSDYEARANMMWCATMALNNLIGQGVPQDWSTHRIGHEITALYGLDHAQSLAVVLPALMDEMRDEKREKLIQFGHRVWGITVADEEVVIDQAIAKTRGFFESLGISTMMKGYDVPFAPAQVVAQLERHGLIAIGEREKVTPTIVRKVLAQV